MPLDVKGIGMTSQRTRDRLAKTLVEMGIKSEAVLDVIRKTPRHFFIDEALASRAYENTALPIGFNQTISQVLQKNLVFRDRLTEKISKLKSS